jgi:antitoxin VapB
MNIKNPKASDVAAQLIELTGESLTTAVIRALEMRLAAERGKRAHFDRAEQMTAFAKRFASGMPRTASSADHADIYDEDGLPR